MRAGRRPHRYGPAPRDQKPADTVAVNSSPRLGGMLTLRQMTRVPATLQTTCVIFAAGCHVATRHPLLEPVAGYPLLARSLQAATTALGSHRLNGSVVVCCDDPLLARLATRLGAQVLALAELAPTFAALSEGSLTGEVPMAWAA
ncbi:MAG: hypothetical protein RJA70_856, partial [Pseudomonadota bacterium]